VPQKQRTDTHTGSQTRDTITALPSQCGQCSPQSNFLAPQIAIKPIQTGSVGVGGGVLVTCKKLNFGVPEFTPRDYSRGFTPPVPGVTVEARYARACPRRTSGFTRCREAVLAWILRSDQTEAVFSGKLYPQTVFT
jgi:hypothetical protein